ncbi:MAG: NUDIX hydrolase [Candidatus Korarchaeum sp.]|nr:NUDIX hydrolase [Candidatus Korarchaeum sp.]MDW8035288.1 NUDIX hydrolase [Candidatus Korarchaeum sp.]
MREFPRYAIASVGAVLLRNGELLLVRRGFPPGQGKWSIPGGVIEAGESLLEAARRELLEETNLEAEPLGVIALSQVIVSEGNLIKYHYIIVDVIFDESSLRGEEKPGGDATCVSWFPLDEVLSKEDVTSSTRRLASVLKERTSYLSLRQVI